MKARGALIAPAESVVKAKQEKEESPETQLKLSHVCAPDKWYPHYPETHANDRNHCRKDSKVSPKST